MRRQPAAVQATLYYQATPPFYLQDRFCTSSSKDTKRLYYVAGKLNLAGARRGLEAAGGDQRAGGGAVPHLSEPRGLKAARVAWIPAPAPPAGPACSLRPALRKLPLTALGVSPPFPPVLLLRANDLLLCPPSRVPSNPSPPLRPASLLPPLRP